MLGFPLFVAGCPFLLGNAMSTFFHRDHRVNSTPNNYHRAFSFMPSDDGWSALNKPLSGYLGLYWASSSKYDNGFWSAYSWLCPRDAGLLLPGGSFLAAKLDTQLLEKSLGAETHKSQSFFMRPGARCKHVNVGVRSCLILSVLHNIRSCTHTHTLLLHLCVKSCIIYYLSFLSGAAMYAKASNMGIEYHLERILTVVCPHDRCVW